MRKNAPLLFGNNRSHDFNSAYDIKLFYSGLLNNVVGLETSESNNFYSRSSSQRIGDLTLKSTAVSPFFLKTKPSESNTLTFIAPLIGSVIINAENEHINMKSGRSFLLSLSDKNMEMNRGEGGSLFFNTKIECLERIIAANNGLEVDRFSKINISQTRAIDGNSLNWDYCLVLQNLTKIIDQFDGNEQQLAEIGLDDVIQRTIINIFYEEKNEKHDDCAVELANRSDRSVDILCDKMRQFSGKVMTMTEMQETTGLSNRSLQLAFNRRFGCTPRQWQRNEHLGKARQLLISSNNNQSIKQISHQLGFTSVASLVASVKVV